MCVTRASCDGAIPVSSSWRSRTRTTYWLVAATLSSSLSSLVTGAVLQIVRRRSRVLRQRTMRRVLFIGLIALVLVPAAGASVRLYTGDLAVVDDPYGPARLVDLSAGRVRALYPSGRAFSIGSGFATATPVRGRARFDAHGATIGGRQVRLLPLRSIPVRFRSDGATLAGTLMVPPGGGRRGAVAYVTGSGPTTREYLPELQALLLHDGVAVLAYDKRGIGASGGSYPGESPTDTAIDQLARDAAAAARFLTGRAE